MTRFGGEPESGYEKFSKYYKYFDSDEIEVGISIVMGTISWKSSYNPGKVSDDLYNVINYLMGDCKPERKKIGNIVCKLSGKEIKSPAILPQNISNHEFNNVLICFDDHVKNHDQIIVQYTNEDKQNSITNTLNLILKFLPADSDKEEQSVNTIKQEIAEFMKPILENTISDKIEYVSKKVNLFENDGFSIIEGEQDFNNLKNIWTGTPKSARSIVAK